MGSKKEVKQKATKSVITLATIVAAGADGCFTPSTVHDSLLKQGFVETNPAVVDAGGWVATRATQAGIDFVNNNENLKPGAGDTVKPTVANTGKFEIETVEEIPPANGRGRGASMYPFESLEVGKNNSFFVANTEAKPNVYKSLASTVSSATQRYTEVIDGVKTVTRKFEVREATKIIDGVEVKGARVFRTA